MLQRAVALVVVVVAGCAPVAPVIYQPHPERIADPRAELAAMFAKVQLSNVRWDLQIRTCRAEPQWSGPHLAVHWACDDGTAFDAGALDVDRVSGVRIEQEGTRYFVRVGQGSDSLRWFAGDLSDAERVVDLVTALADNKAS